MTEWRPIDIENAQQRRSSALSETSDRVRKGLGVNGANLVSGKALAAGVYALTTL